VTLRKVYLEITTECNLDCGMCIRHAWSEPAQRMAHGTFQRILDDLRSTGTIQTLHFGGFGEPLTHPQCLEFLRQAAQAGLGTELLTNGVLLDQATAAALIDLGLDRLIVSLDQASLHNDPDFHSQAATVHANLREVYRQRLVRRASRPEVVIEFVATRKNFHELPALKRLGLQLGFSRILVTHLVPYTPELANDVLYDDWTTTRRDADGSPWNPAIDLPRMDPRVEVQTVLDRLRASGSDVLYGGAPLSGGRMYCRFTNEGRVAVTPDGCISPCLPLLHSHAYYFRGARREVVAYRLGNVLQSRLSEVWQSDTYRAFRARLRDFRFSPCIDCGGCDLRSANLEDCHGNEFPTCGSCLWAAGLVQCP
jgi:MoaA/NifB/PqqE/SkfB family radical SAM enzyme